MFKSKIRSLIIPQYEHGHFAGTLASLWGNDEFERPAIDFEPFVQGVALHDWHYGHIDNIAIGEAAEAEWFRVVRRGVNHEFDDPIMDIVVKLHIRRLLSGWDSLEAKALVNQIESRLSERLPQTNFSHAQFEWADRITDFCDSIAFGFSFGNPLTAKLQVFAQTDSNAETTICYEITPDGEIRVDPWPFSVDRISGIMIGYRQKGYPEILSPQIVRFDVKKYKM